MTKETNEIGEIIDNSRLSPEEITKLSNEKFSKYLKRQKAKTFIRLAKDLFGEEIVTEDLKQNNISPEVETHSNLFKHETHCPRAKDGTGFCLCSPEVVRRLSYEIFGHEPNEITEKVTEDLKQKDISPEVQSNSSSKIEGLTGKGDLSNKALFSAIDPRLMYEVGIGFRKGATKHGLNNFRKMTLEAAQGVMDALERHTNDYKRGIAIDPETGVSNLALIVTNASMLYRIARNYSHKEVIEAMSCGDITEEGNKK